MKSGVPGVPLETEETDVVMVEVPVQPDVVHVDQDVETGSKAKQLKQEKLAKEKAKKYEIKRENLNKQLFEKILHTIQIDLEEDDEEEAQQAAFRACQKLQHFTNEHLALLLSRDNQAFFDIVYPVILKSDPIDIPRKPRSHKPFRDSMPSTVTRSVEKNNFNQSMTNSIKSESACFLLEEFDKGLNYTDRNVPKHKRMEVRENKQSERSTTLPFPTCDFRPLITPQFQSYQSQCISPIKIPPLRPLTLPSPMSMNIHPSRLIDSPMFDQENQTSQNMRDTRPIPIPGASKKKNIKIARRESVDWGESGLGFPVGGPKLRPPF